MIERFSLKSLLYIAIITIFIFYLQYHPYRSTNNRNIIKRNDSYSNIHRNDTKSNMKLTNSLIESRKKPIREEKNTKGSIKTSIKHMTRKSFPNQYNTHKIIYNRTIKKKNIRNICGNNTFTRYDSSMTTGRGYSKILEAFPKVLFDVDKYFFKHSNATVLDYGCGSGRFLLELLSNVSNLQTYCINKIGYRNQQAETVQDLIDVAASFNINLHCIDNTSYVLPKIYLTSGMSSDNHSDPFFQHKFDFISSMHALNLGKLYPFESHLWIDKLIPMLNNITESRMLLLLNEISYVDTYLSFLNNSKNPKENLYKIKSWEYFDRFDITCVRVSLYIHYIRDNWKHHYEYATVPYMVAFIQKYPNICTIENDKFDTHEYIIQEIFDTSNNDSISKSDMMYVNNSNFHLLSAYYSYNLIKYLDRKTQYNHE